MKTYIFILVFSAVMTFFASTSYANVTNVTSGGLLFPDFNSALAAANNGDVLRGQNAMWFEEASVPPNLHVTIDGGYDATFTTKIGNSFVSSSSGQPVFFINPGAHVFFDSLWVSGGDGTGLMGGGISALSSTGIVVNSVIFDCNAQFGAGLYSAGLIVISNTIVNGNSAHQDGGGVFVRSDSAFYAYDNSIIANNVSGGSGGGLYAQGNTVVHLVDTIVGDNVATNNGGGVYTQQSEVVLRDSIVAGNAALTTSGGGVYSLNDTLRVYDSWIGMQSSPNTSPIMGAGLMAEDVDIQMQNVIVEGNTGDLTYAAAMYVTAVEPVWFSNVFVRYNTSEFVPGIDVYAFAGMEVYNLQIVSNSGIYWANSLYAESNLFIDTLYVAYNTITSSGVGGINVSLSQGSGVVTRPTVVHNSTSNGTGGLQLWVNTSSILNIDDAHISENEGYGVGGVGGLKADGSQNSLVRLRAVAQPVNITQNKGGGTGGLRAEAGTVELHAPTATYPVVIADNSADTVGGVMLAASFSYPHTSRWYGAVHVLSNQAQHGGVLMANTSLGTNPTLLQTIPTNNLYAHIAFNTALNSGGGIHVEGQETYARLYGTHIADNTAALFGGGIYVSDQGNLEALNTWVYNNISSNYGGGVAVLDANSVARFDADFPAVPTTYLPLTRIVNNRALFQAGGIGVGGFATLDLYNTLVASNVVETGAGGGVRVTGTAFADVKNTVIAHNQASSGANGLSVNSANFLIENSTIAHNSNEGIVTFNSPGTFVNTIVWGHGGNEFNEINFTSTLSHCIVEGGYPGTSVLTGDPLFMNAPALNYQLSSGSAAIDTGVVTSVTTDCIGTPRPHFMAYDIGAYEFVPEPTSFVFFGLAGLWALRRRG